MTLLGEGGNPLEIDSQLTENDFYTLTSVVSWIAKSSSKKRVFHSLTNLSEVDDFEYSRSHFQREDIIKFSYPISNWADG